MKESILNFVRCSVFKGLAEAFAIIKVDQLEGQPSPRMSGKGPEAKIMVFERRLSLHNEDFILDVSATANTDGDIFIFHCFRKVFTGGLGAQIFKDLWASVTPDSLLQCLDIKNSL